VLGPIELERVRLLIQKDRIQGIELAKEIPDGEWVDINLIEPIAELLMAKASGRLDQVKARPVAVPLDAGSTRVLAGPTQVLPVSTLPPFGLTPIAVISTEEKESSISKTVVDFAALPREEAPKPIETKLPDIDSGILERGYQIESASVTSDLSEIAKIDSMIRVPTPDEIGHRAQAPVEIAPYQPPRGRNISEEKTIVFQRSHRTDQVTGKKPSAGYQRLKSIIVILAVGMAAYDLMLPEPPKAQMSRSQVIRPRLPKAEAQVNPQKSVKLYGEAMMFYIADTVAGYREAANRLLASAGADMSNVKALAMLASCYLNLIDDSNKDENYFSVISKLIDMSRAKSVDLPETVIADVEFYIIANKPEAAQSRIVEYTKTHQNFDPSMFYYLSLAFYSQGDTAAAARFLGQLPDNRVFSAKIFFLRGLIAEKLNDLDQALSEYGKAIQFSKIHAKSHLRTAIVMNRKGQLKVAAQHVEYATTHQSLLSPRDLAQAYQLSSQLYSTDQKWDEALGQIERASRLDPANSDYLLEKYSLRARLGDKNPAIREEARMFYFLGEGERQVKDGRYQDALSQFQQARQANLKSPLPLVKIGDMFQNQNDVGNARDAYRLAAERAPNSIEVWSKYISSLIQSFEWVEAEKAMNRFRKLQASPSAIDKLAGDMYAKQGRHAEAQTHYKNSMARETIDPKVYISYAQSLMATKNYGDAAFFFALALRFDPLNMEAVLGTARSVAASDSIDRAIAKLQSELNRGTTSRAELQAAIGEFQIQKAEWDAAQASVSLAMEADPEYAYPWKLQAQIYMSREGADKTALDRALDSYKSYSDRNGSDPSGYLERYKIFIKKTDYEKANDELNRIYAIYPKYPNLHYYKGALYVLMSNLGAAITEFNQEISNNPNNVPAILALGKTLLEAGKPKEALELFNKAMMIAPQAPEPKHQAGYANYLMKNFQGAVALYNAAIQLDRQNPLLYKRLGMAHRDQGNTTGARTSFKKYIEMEPDAMDRAQFERFL